MPFILAAPAQSIQTTSVFPNPQFNDTEGRRLSVEVKRSMNNTKRTYVKSNGRSRMTYTFRLSRNKGLELRAFVASYYAAKLRWTDHLGDVWVGYFVNNPFEFTGEGRAAGTPGGEATQVTLQLEGERVAYGSRSEC